ncbi:MAG TPA: sodium:proline symporter [Candidatus Melainabacteria bacterium]|nr:sodium:proline symporter [Candidatus Melainabacteria bacterium]HIN64919.1 sodium:proline symporter [Candidatus Obscuribacterales bacterium]
MNSGLQIAIDIAVILAYFGAVMFVGLRFAEKESNLESFALGGRSIPWWAVLASIIAAETSAATFLGTPGEGYKLVNYTFLQLVFGTIIGRIIVAFLFIKPFYDLKVYSIYEFLEWRFGKRTRQAASAIFLLTRTLASGARLYVAAIVLAVGFSIMTGAQANHAEQLVIYISSIVLITALTAIYTSLGGIKAVIWTDCIQSTVMFTGALGAILVLLAQIQNTGGANALRHLIESGSLSLFTSGTISGETIQKNILNILTSEYTIWAALLGMTFTTLATHGTDQDMVQRMLTATDYKKSRLSLVLSGIADLPIGFIFLTIGILMSIYFQSNHDPGLPEKTNEVFAYFILKHLPAGLRGLLIAGIFATSMGSLSAALNALATSYTRDWHKASVAEPVSKTKEHEGERGEREEDEAVRTVRRFTYVFAVFMILVASATAYFVIEHPESRIIPIVLGIFGYTYGSLLGVFLVGLLTKSRGNDLGNLIAMCAGFVIVAIFSGLPDQIFHFLSINTAPAFPQIAFPFRILAGALTTFGCACLFPSPKRA